jgi:hypothetical protein
VSAAPSTDPTVITSAEGLSPAPSTAHLSASAVGRGERTSFGLQPPFAYFGGKTTLASRIVDLLPAHEHYMEPFCGGSSVLLAKTPSTMETVNDLDGRLIYLDIARTAVAVVAGGPPGPGPRTERPASGAPREWRIAVAVERPSPGLISGQVYGHRRSRK